MINGFNQLKQMPTSASPHLNASSHLNDCAQFAKLVYTSNYGNDEAAQPRTTIARRHFPENWSIDDRVQKRPQ